MKRTLDGAEGREVGEGQRRGGCFLCGGGEVTVFSGLKVG